MITSIEINLNMTNLTQLKSLVTIKYDFFYLIHGDPFITLDLYDV